MRVCRPSTMGTSDMIVAMCQLDEGWAIEQVSVLESRLDDRTGWTKTQVQRELTAPDRTYIADIRNSSDGSDIGSQAEFQGTGHFAADDDTKTWLANGWTSERPTAVMRGYAGYWHDGLSGEMTSVNVDPRHRRVGVGAGLVKWIIEDAKRHHIQRLTLEVRPDNIPAKALYDGFGFRHTTRLKNYYGQGVDADEMALDFEPRTVGFVGVLGDNDHRREGTKHE